MPSRRRPRELWLDIDRPIVWERDRGVCQGPHRPPICQGKEGDLTLETCHIDHIIPLSQGGTNHVSNLRVLCRSCHVLRLNSKHRGMIGGALRDGVIPPDWRGLVWE